MGALVGGAAGAFLYGIFRVLGAIIGAIFRHPIMTIIVAFLIFTINGCMIRHNFGAINIPVLMHGDQSAFENRFGTPDSCVMNFATETQSCHYTDVDVAYHNSVVTKIEFHRLDGEKFDNNERFYHRVLGMLNIPYRVPDVSTIDKVEWNIPNIGMITVTSDGSMNISGIIIRG